MSVKISEVEQVFKELFDEEKGLVSSVETLYEKTDDENVLKLIISIHGLSIEDTSIIHTKFIFKCDNDKINLVENDFFYLFDINCVYKRITFKNSIDLKHQLEDVILSNNFGQDIQILSDFIGSPAMFLNHYLRREKITEYSVFDVEYTPKFKTVPCEKITFDFKININDNYNIDLSVAKVDKKSDDDYDVYKFQFKFMDEIIDEENDTLTNFHYFIGSNIAKILDRKLKNQ